MDWDLWGPSYGQGAPESGYRMGPGCQFDFYFRYGLDVLEETALNEKSCAQVLRILITKADTEIDELEKDLVVLQSQLACAEHEEWSDICCTAIREKIDCLSISAQSLRNEMEHDVNVHLLMRRGPAERIHEIVKALIKNHLQEKDEKPLDAIIKESSSDALVHTTDFSDEKKKFRNFDSNIIIKEEIKEPAITPTEKCKVLNSSLNPRGKKADYPETVKPADIIVTSSNVDASKHKTGHSSRKTKLSKSGSNITIEEVKGCSSTPPNKTITLDSSSMPGDKRADLGGKPADIIVRSSNVDASEHVTGHSRRKKKLSKSGLNITRVLVQGHSSTPNEIITLDSSSMPAENRTYPGGKPSNTTVKGSSSDARKHATGNSNKNENMGKSDSNVKGKEEVKGQNSTPMDESIIFKSSLKSARKGTNLPKMDKRANVIVEDSSSDALRHATGFSGKKKLSNFGSRLDALRQAKSGDSRKRGTFTLKSTTNEGIKKSKVALANKTDPSNSSLETEGKKMNLLERGKVQDADLTDTERYAVTSILELEVQSGKDTTKPQPEGEGMPQPEVQKVEIVANDKSNLKFSLKAQKQKARSKIQSNQSGVQEPNSLLMEIGSNSSSISEARRQRISGSGDDDATLGQFLNGKIWKKLVHPDRRGAEECSVTDTRKKSVSQSHKKRKTSSVLPIIVEIKDFTFPDDLTKSHEDTADIASNEDDPITKSCFIDNSDNETLASLPSSRLVNLNDLTLIDLKAIAKQHKMRSYYKLRKDDLVKQLADRLG